MSTSQEQVAYIILQTEKKKKKKHNRTNSKRIILHIHGIYKESFNAYRPTSQNLYKYLHHKSLTTLILVIYSVVISLTPDQSFSLELSNGTNQTRTQKVVYPGTLEVP